MQLSTIPQAEAAEMMPADYKLYAAHEAELMSIDESSFVGTLDCESHFNPTAVGKLGEKGIAQIYQKYHHDVTDSEAFDGIWSINFAAGQFKEGNQRLWSCYNRLYVQKRVS